MFGIHEALVLLILLVEVVTNFLRFKEGEIDPSSPQEESQRILRSCFKTAPMFMSFDPVIVRLRIYLNRLIENVDKILCPNIYIHIFHYKL